METMEEVKSLLGEILQISERAAQFDAETALFGSIPELDSMAVATLIAGLEDHFGFIVDDDEMSADTFSTVGALTEFVDQKLQS